MKHLLITTISAVVLLGCGKAQKPTLSSEAKSDEFDLVIRKDLEDLFAKTKAGKNFVEEKLSRDSYNAKQKGKLAKLLKEERKGLGVAFFHTNGKNYGKLLYTWGVGPKLHFEGSRGLSRKRKPFPRIYCHRFRRTHRFGYWEGDSQARCI
jgi:hypothetical protein